MCYSFGKRKLDLLNIKDLDYNVCEKDTVIFAFGEIDCRCHILKQCINNDYKSMIDEIVNNYAAAIEANVIQYASLKTCVLSIVPSVRAHQIKQNKEFPYSGTDEERKECVAYYNRYVKCAQTKTMCLLTFTKLMRMMKAF